MRLKSTPLLLLLLPAALLGGRAVAWAQPAMERGVARDQGSKYLEQLFHQIWPRFFTAEGSWWAIGLCMLLACAMVFGFVNLFALFAVWLERKVSAHMQCRLGPMEVGWHGALQTLADGIKLTVKEDLVPRLVDRPLFSKSAVVRGHLSHH